MLETKRKKEGREEPSVEEEEDAWNPGIQDGWW